MNTKIIFEKKDVITSIITICDDKICDSKTFFHQNVGGNCNGKFDIMIKDLDLILAKIKEFEKKNENLTFHFYKTDNFTDFYVELNGELNKAFSL